MMLSGNFSAVSVILTKTQQHKRLFDQIHVRNPVWNGLTLSLLFHPRDGFQRHFSDEFQNGLQTSSDHKHPQLFVSLPCCTDGHQIISEFGLLPRWDTLTA